VLFVCDETVASSHVFHAALQTAQEQAASLRGICIVKSLPVAADLIMEGALEQDQAACNNVLCRFNAAACAVGVHMDAEVVFGNPREQIARAVIEFDIDFLVMPRARIGSGARLLQQYIVQKTTRRREITIMMVDNEGRALLTL
jgi:hypothetical protein